MPLDFQKAISTRVRERNNHHHQEVQNHAAGLCNINGSCDEHVNDETRTIVPKSPVREHCNHVSIEHSSLSRK